MTADLVAFLRARLDEDERDALGTLDPLTVIGRLRGKPEQRWKQTESGRGIIDADGGTLRVRDVYPAEAEHIVRHDPARVLAEVEAKRRIIEQHHRSGVTCPRCSLGTEDGQVVFERDPCETLRALALPYAGHPDYQPAWAPEE